MVIRCASSTEADMSLPSVDELNPYGLGWCDGEPENNDEGAATWLPVPNLTHSKESVRFREALSNVLQDVHLEVSPEELEARASTPQYKLEERDWAMHDLEALDVSVIKTVARIPADLLDADDVPETMPVSDMPSVSGWLKKRGEGNTSMKKRFMQLEGNVIAYYKREVDNAKYPRSERAKLQKGMIELEKISCFQPCADRDLWWAFELVTTNRTWLLQADSEAEYMKWVNALCHTVSFQVVNIVYRRMLCLQEVRATAKTDVRLNLPPAFTVQEAIRHVFRCYETTVGAAPLLPYDADDFVLKLTGFKDYLIEPTRRVVDYQYVRECLVTKKMLRLSVVPKSALATTPSHTRVLSNIKSAGRLSSLHTTSIAQFEADASLLSSAPAIAPIDDEAPLPSVSVIAKSCHCKEPLRFCVNRAVNVPSYTSTLKRTSHDMGIEKTPLTYANVFVRVELFDGGQRLEDPVEVADTKLRVQTADKSARWTANEYVATWEDAKWYRTKMKIRDLPRTARLVLTLYGVKLDAGGKPSVSWDDRERICSTAINIFDVDGLLVQGDVFNQLLSNVHALRVGPVPHTIDAAKPYLHVTMASFPTDVQYRLRDLSNNEEEVDEDDDALPSALAIHKKGWLKKLGQQGSLSKWRKRWFTLDSATCSLSYSESVTVPATKHISLKLATVLICDSLKETYTTFAVNKGTRREQRTWGFKLKPHDSSRVYLIAADSKQDREEWMAAIRAVAYEASDNQNEFKDLDDAFLSQRGSAVTMSMASGSASGSASSDDLKRLEDPETPPLSSTSSVAAVLDEVKMLIDTDPLVRLNRLQKTVLWTHRHQFVASFKALPRVLSCVQWTNAGDVYEAKALMASWAAPAHPAAYLELLDVEFAHEVVRKFAVDKLAEMADTTFSYFLPQLVQALKYESYHASPLALHLIERGLRNPNQIGFDLFWALKVEADNDRFRERYGTLLNCFIDASSSRMRDVLFVQSQLFSPTGALEGICQFVKALKAQRKTMDEIRAEMRLKLEALNPTLPRSYQLPIDPRVEVGKLIVAKCKVMSSAKLPLWLVFENAEAGGDPVVVIFKSGDDVRQDSLTLQLIRVMDDLWRDQGLDLAMEPYKCVATGPMTGILQVVLNSITTADIHKRVGTLGAFDETSFTNWITANNQDKKSFKSAVDLFRRSCAGYCVATCVLGIGDRHNDNIMLTHSGRYFHIDFGHFLGHFKYQFGIKREKTPFVFTPEMAHVLGGTASDEFRKFQLLCSKAFNVVRLHVHFLVTLFLLMIPAEMPELRSRDDINHLVEVCVTNLSEEDAAKNFDVAIDFCLGSRFKRWDNTLHIVAHKYL
ncbi:phosphatidylinositol kinase [Achlya hypogyna]|uniref:phosphatidylinositol 3-kinase n=1 Tax=Achlya hypogyna TaxID=1202772 RepID=A0A1V9YN87_ACHHY|nr:phosphatidylinositol kinase [Achlya hypogyna]